MADTFLLYVDAAYADTDYTEELPVYLGASLQAGSFTFTATAYVDHGLDYVINDYVANGYVGFAQGSALVNLEFQTQIQSLRSRPGSATSSLESTLASTALRLRDAQVGYEGDRLAKTISTYGNVSISTSQSKFGGGSALISDTGDYFTVPGDSTLYNGDFTIEMWAWATNLTQMPNGTIWDNRTSTSSGFYLYVSYGSIGLYEGITGKGLTSAGFNNSQWNHIAVVRNGTNIKVFVNGVQKISATVTSTNYSNRTTYIGSTYTGIVPFRAYIDEVRLSSNARYTTGFTPSTSAFASDGDVRALLHLDADFSDDTGYDPGLEVAATVVIAGNRLASGDLTSLTLSSLLADADVVRYASGIELGTLTLTSQVKVFRGAAAGLSAFNTALYAGTRMRFGSSDLTSTLGSSQTALRIRSGSNGIVSWLEIPVTGIEISDTLMDTYDDDGQVIVQDQADLRLLRGGLPSLSTNTYPEYIDDFVFSIWARAESTGGTLLSAYGQTESAYIFHLSAAGLGVTWYNSGGQTSGFTQLLEFTSVDIREWHHYWVKCETSIISGPLKRYSLELWVDGSLTDTSVIDLAISNTGTLVVADKPRIGLSHQGAFKGVLAQVWLGSDISQYTWPEIGDFYNLGWRDLGSLGTLGSGKMLPDWYEAWDYPYARTENTSSLNYPQRLLNPAPAIFTVSATGDNIIGGDAVLTTSFTCLAEALRVQQGVTDLSTSALVAASALKLYPGSAVLAGQFSLTPAPTIESFGSALLEAFAFEIAVATTELLGQASLATAFTLTATSTDFTKASADLAMAFTTNFVATALIPTKGNVITAGLFTVLGFADVIRGAEATLAVETTLATLALRIRADSALLSALAFAISAGRLIEFVDLYKLSVARETGQLLVPWEPRLFEIEKETCINTVSPEQREVSVSQERGLLLVDEEQ